MRTKPLTLSISKVLAILAFAARAANASVIVQIGTASVTNDTGSSANANAANTSSFQIDVGAANSLSVSSSSLATYSAAGSNPATGVFYTGSGTATVATESNYVTVQVDLARNINTSTGELITSPGTNSATLNALGIGILGAPDGNFLGSDGTTFEGLLISVNTSNLAVGSTLVLTAFQINVSGTTSYSAGVINAATDTSQNFSATGVGGLQTFTLTTPLSIAGGTGLTHFATIWQPTDSAGFRVKSLTFDIIPEPSAALLGGLGMLVLLRRRR
jgi:hypothetical protein